MKKYLLIIVLVSLSSGMTMNLVSAADDPPKPITVIVTEEIPWGDCKCTARIDAWVMGWWWPTSCWNPATRKYSCTVQPGLVGFETTFASIIRYVIYIVMLLGVLGIVALGIAWTFAGWDDIKMKSALKKWGVNILVGLTLLFLFSYILRFLAPWVYK